MAAHVSVPDGGQKGRVRQRQVFVQPLGKENPEVCERRELKQC